MNSGWTQHRFWTALTYLLGFLPLYLLWHGDNAFYLDWKNHLWEISYFGEYFRQHRTFPLTLNTEQLIGMPYPVFYGYLFYPAAGLISALTGGSIALRLICSLVFLLQIRQVSKTVETVSGSRPIAFVVTILVCFAIYPLTNLYNRAAITEFIAASLVLSVCMMWLRIVRMDDLGRRRRMVLRAAFILAFAMGTHPITAVLGGSMMALMIVSTLPFPHHPRDLWRSLGVSAALIAIVMAPWFYAVLRFRNTLQMPSGTIFSFPQSLDRLITRFYLIPWDPRMGTEEFQKWGTPHFDTQINLAMLILACYLVYRSIRQASAYNVRAFRIALAALAGFVVVCIASVSEQLWHYVPSSLKFIQFLYRLVTYADLFLLLAVLFLLAGLRRTSLKLDRPMAAVLLICLAFSARNINIKLAHARDVEEPNSLVESRWESTNGDGLRSISPVFYGATGYAVQAGSRGLMDNTLPLPLANLPTGTQEHFGEVSPLPIFTNLGLLRTNVQIFPWNRLVWNGREIPFEELSSTLEFRAVLSTQGGAGTLAYVFRPDALWLGLHVVSFGVTALWMVALLGWPVISRRGR